MQLWTHLTIVKTGSKNIKLFPSTSIPEQGSKISIENKNIQHPAKSSHHVLPGHTVQFLISSLSDSKIHLLSATYGGGGVMFSWIGNKIPFLVAYQLKTHQKRDRYVPPNVIKKKYQLRP